MNHNLNVLEEKQKMKAQSETLTVYKLVRKMKDGRLAPLFINAKSRLALGEWLPAEDHPTKGFAHRPGWHCCFHPVAPHLSEKGRVWIEVKIKDTTTYKRPESQGGSWVLANQMKVIRELSKLEVDNLRKSL